MDQKRQGNPPLKAHSSKPWYPDIESHQQKGGQKRRLSEESIKQLKERTKKLGKEIIEKQRAMSETMSDLESKG